jgi:hypothetical protein
MTYYRPATIARTCHTVGIIGKTSRYNSRTHQNPKQKKRIFLVNLSVTNITESNCLVTGKSMSTVERNQLQCTIWSMPPYAHLLSSDTLGTTLTYFLTNTYAC